MSLSVVITPGGQLLISDDPEDVPAVPEGLATQLKEAFARSSAEGLLLLSTGTLDQELPPPLVYWRGLARDLFQAVCQLGEGGFDHWRRIAPPVPEQLAQLAMEAPPMRGLEYLDVPLLQSLWNELRELMAKQAAAHPGGAAAWLRAINPVWRLLGRVTLHLAENKRDPEHPFAFLATYTHKLSGQTRLQHLPLAEALRTYAAAQDRDKLDSLLEPVRRAAERSPLMQELLDGGALFRPQAWTIRQAHRFLSESARMEEAGVVLRLPDWWSARRPPRPQVQVRIGGRPSSALGSDGLLDFEVGLALDGEPLTEAERQQLLAGTEGLALLRGKWIEVDRARLQQALAHWQVLEQNQAGGIDFIQGMRLLAGANLGGESPLDAEVSGWTRITTGDWLRETLERLRNPTSSDQCQPGRDLQATLRPYQSDGVRWLWFMTQLGLGACLADDMGLGKTIQIIDLLLQRKRVGTGPGSGQTTPCLLIIPASLLGNWRAELARFAPGLRAFFAHASESDGEDLQRVARSPVRELATYDLVVTTYGLARRQPWLEKLHWSLVILDEAQAIKNGSSAQTRSVKKIPARGRIVLTGTPVENHLGDLWSLFDFCCPGLLGNATQFKQFVKRLNKQQDTHAFGALRRLVRPYILRRMKTDPSIIRDLPAKTEMRTECGLSKKQAALYEQAVKDLARRLKTSDGIARRGLVLAVLMQLKQICNHPAQYLGNGAFSPNDSGKFERLELLCEPIVQRQEKLLVFTQFQAMTQPLADYLSTFWGRPGLVLHGGTPIRRRTDLVREFQEEQGPPFFVISVKAGGSGLNLMAASHVVHFDRWWNPAVENQATDRAFRIGQKRNVLVHKFVCRGTVEERIDGMIRDKQALADQLLGQESEPQLTEMSDDELLQFVSLDIDRATAAD
ncbi:MAG: DEAD/DEAH box helicase [Planctomycetales bacterium]